MKSVLLGIAMVAKAESAGFVLFRASFPQRLVLDEVNRLVSDKLLCWENSRDRNTLQLVLDIREIACQLPTTDTDS